MKTFVLIKPDGVRRGLVGECLSRFEKVGFAFKGLKILKLSKEKAEKLYAVHKGKPFYMDLISYITSGPVVAVVLEIDLDPENTIKIVRKIVGATNPVNAEMGSIRGDYGSSVNQNIVHASDSHESAVYEIPIFFDKDELL